MLLIIFGAGASYDASSALPDHQRLPLVKNLLAPGVHFNDAATAFPSARPIISALRAFLNADPNGLVEQKLAELQESASSNPERRRHLLAFRFFLQKLIADSCLDAQAHDGGINNYVHLLDAVGEWRSKNSESVALLTLNYDTLLDAAFSAQVGQPLRDEENVWPLDNYVKDPSWKLFKPHGSIDWSREIDFPTGYLNPGPEQVIAVGDTIPLDDGLIIPTPRNQIGPHGLYIPALAVPTNTKTTFECPPNHLAELEAIIPEVTAILIVGWRAQEPHLLEMFKDVQPGIEIGVVDKGAEQTNTVFRNFHDVAAKARSSQQFEQGFSAFINSGSHIDWLNTIHWDE